MVCLSTHQKVVSHNKGVAANRTLTTTTLIGGLFKRRLCQVFTVLLWRRVVDADVYAREPMMILDFFLFCKEGFFLAVSEHVWGWVHNVPP